MIVVDSRWINISGIGTYLSNLLPGILCGFPDERFLLLGDEDALRSILPCELSNFTIRPFHSKMYSLDEQLKYLSLIPNDAKLYFCPHYNIPVFYSGKLLVTVYDLFHLAMPELVGGIHKSLYAKFMFNLVRRNADEIITISEFTKQELLKYTAGSRDNISSIHLGIDNTWFEVKSGATQPFTPYILYVGNIKPHKNLSLLVRAFQKIMHLIPHNLVLVGKREGFITGDPGLSTLVAHVGDRIQFTGYVEKDILQSYFAGATALIFPSLYEGFGFPPLEAMAVGCPVISSVAGPMKEICGDAALFFNPRSEDDLSDKILSLLGNETLRRTLVNRGHERAKIFKWESCVLQTNKIIAHLLSIS